MREEPANRTAAARVGIGAGAGAVVRDGKEPTTATQKKKPVDKEHDNERVVAHNRRAKFEYEILDSLECGIVLVGSEVKSLRRGQCVLDDAYGRVVKGEVVLMQCEIPEYVEANRFNHQPRRPRKLLLHRREIAKFVGKAFETGYTLVPLKVYFKGGRAKVLLGVGKGKKTHDKRETIKKREAEREIGRALRRR